MAVPELDLGIDPATHAFRRSERRQGDGEVKKRWLLGACDHRGSVRTRLWCGAAWMAGSIPGSSPGTARTADVRRRVGSNRPTSIAIRASAAAIPRRRRSVNAGGKRHCWAAGAFLL